MSVSAEFRPPHPATGTAQRPQQCPEHLEDIHQSEVMSLSPAEEISLLDERKAGGLGGLGLSVFFLCGCDRIKL